MTVDRDEMLAHVAVMAAATDLPLNADSERCFGDDPAGVEDTVDRIGQAGAAGCSIEDWNPATDAIDPIDVASERVRAAARRRARHGVVLTAAARTTSTVSTISTTPSTASWRTATPAPRSSTRRDSSTSDRSGACRRGRRPVNVLLRPGGPTVGSSATSACAHLRGVRSPASPWSPGRRGRHLLDDGQYAPDEAGSRPGGAKAFGQ